MRHGAPDSANRAAAVTAKSAGATSATRRSSRPSATAIAASTTARTGAGGGALTPCSAPHGRTLLRAGFSPHDTRLARMPRVSDLLRAPVGAIDLHAFDARATPGFEGGKADAQAEHAALADRLSALQEQLYAEGRLGGSRSVLLVLQGMDTSGKGGTVRHVVGQVNPSGLRVVAFGPPTAEDRRHDFLWRIRRQLPRPGQLGVFDRSHYEDVVTVRVRGLVERRTWMRRYDAIDRFEAQLAAHGTRVVKCFLHISPQEQRERLLARVDDPTKHWKFDPADLDARERWEEYLEAYADAITRCSSDIAPWHIVPADRKWYRNWAVTRLLSEQLEELALRWPEPPFDIELQRRRLLAIP
jgi:PPK2 family polyphosphate:nucleotide phosphotransferase